MQNSEWVKFHVEGIVYNLLMCENSIQGASKNPISLFNSCCLFFPYWLLVLYRHGESHRVYIDEYFRNRLKTKEGGPLVLCILILRILNFKI